MATATVARSPGRITGGLVTVLSNSQPAISLLKGWTLQFDFLAIVSQARAFRRLPTVVRRGPIAGEQHAGNAGYIA